MAKSCINYNGKEVLVCEFNNMSDDQKAIAMLQTRFSTQDEVNQLLAEAGVKTACAVVQTAGAVVQTVEALDKTNQAVDYLARYAHTHR